jgi:hypothetical protein
MGQVISIYPYVPLNRCPGFPPGHN